MQATFFVLGASLQLVGIILVGALDIFPPVERPVIRAAAWAERRWRAIENSARRHLGMQPRGRHSHVAVADEGLRMGGDSISTTVGTTATSTKDRIDYLLRRDRATQEAIERLDKRIDASAESVRAELAELRDELTGRLSTEIASAQADYQRARRWGAAALALGLALSTIATFLG